MQTEDAVEGLNAFMEKRRLYGKANSKNPMLS